MHQEKTCRKRLNLNKLDAMENNFYMKFWNFYMWLYYCDYDSETNYLDAKGTCDVQ